MKNYLFLFFSLCLFFFANAQFTVYNTTNSGLNDDKCWFINVDASGKVWVGTNMGGANVYSAGSWSHYTTSNSPLLSNYITPIFFDAAGNTWAGSYTGTGGLAKYNGSSWTVYTTANSNISSNDIMSIAADISGNLWVATRFNGVSMFNGTSWTIFNASNSSLPDDQVYSIETDQAGNVWVGTALYGLWKYSGGSWTSYSMNNSSIPGDNIYCLKYNSITGKLWAGTSSGLGILDPVTNTWIVYTASNSGLAGDYVRGISFSPLTSDAWIATGFNGISKLSGTTWTTYNTSNSNLPNNSVWAIKVTAAGEVWASTWGGGIVYTPEKIRIETGVKEVAKDAALLNLFPNPNNGSFTISNASLTDCELVIVNLMGQVVYKQVIYSGNNSVHSNVMTTGVYSYSLLQSSGNKLTGKLIIDPATH